MATNPELPQLVYGSEYLLPERDSYSFVMPDGSRRSALEGGPMEIATDHLGGPFTVSVTHNAVTMSRVEFLQKFYLRTTLEGSIPFQCALALDGSTIYNDYKVRFAEAPKWSGFRGYSGKVTWSLEVEQRLYSAAEYEYMDALQLLMYDYGDDAPLALSELEQLTNYSWVEV